MSGKRQKVIRGNPKVIAGSNNSGKKEKMTSQENPKEQVPFDTLGVC